MFCSNVDEIENFSTSDSTAMKKTYPVLTGERSVNKVTLIGRLGRDPEARGTENNPVALFSLATSLTLKEVDGEYNQKTDWHRIAVFKPSIRDWVLSNLKKGDRVYVTGSIRYGSYQDKLTNQQVKAVSIVVDDIVNLMKNTEAHKQPTDEEEIDT